MTQTSYEGWRQKNNEDHFILGKCRLLSQIKSTVLLRKATASLDSPLVEGRKPGENSGWLKKRQTTSDRPKLLRSCSTRDRQSSWALTCHSSNLPKSPHGPNSFKYAYFKSCKDLRYIPWAGGGGPAVSVASFRWVQDRVTQNWCTELLTENRFQQPVRSWDTKICQLCFPFFKRNGITSEDIKF